MNISAFKYDLTLNVIIILIINVNKDVKNVTNLYKTVPGKGVLWRGQVE